MAETREPGPARPAKGAAAFRTIGEVADELDLPPHVLRFWESKFPQLKPLKRGGGRRYYRPEDVVLLRHIRQCLYQDGYTIRGVQKLLGRATGDSEAAIAPAAAASLFPLATAAGEPARRRRRRPAAPDTRAALDDIRRELIDARVLLDKLLSRSTTP